MKREIRITKKSARRGEDGHKVVSVRMKDDTVRRLDDLSLHTNRSRNELINLLLEAALEDVLVEEDGAE
ncbi:MAG: ribbon-helix-helix protein, CopG family [Eubacteriales bacterium]|nr:ribbon-helix-helix protein, CopG family [Eubacteriales bacterium]